MADKGFSLGVEKVVWLAAMDKEFCQRLFEDRNAALEDCDIELSRAERLILKGIPDAQLMGVIERISVPRPARRAFLRGAVATAFALMGTVVATSACTLGCRPPQPAKLETGIATALLHQIWMAQKMYRDNHGRFAGTLKELIDTDCLDASFDSDSGDYTFRILKVTEDSFEASAVAQKRGRSSFFVDQTGITRELSGSESERSR